MIDSHCSYNDGMIQTGIDLNHLFSTPLINTLPNPVYLRPSQDLD